MSEESTINNESSKNDVVNFFVRKFSLKDDAKIKMIKEDISGDVLNDLGDEEFKILGIKIGPLKKIKNFLKENKDKFKDKEINEKITVASKPEEVAEFFEKCLNFKGELNNLDGKGLIELDEAGMNKLGLNIGQRKKLVKYINHFKTLKVEQPEESDIILRKESSEDEIAKYLKDKLQFTQEAIEALSLDGEGLFTLEESEIDGADELTQEEKDKLKKLVNELKGNGKETEEKEEINVTKESNEEDVAKFLKQKLGFSENSIKELSLDGESLFTLEESEIDGAEISPEEKDKLKTFLKEEKEKNKKPEIVVTKESSEEEVAQFLKEK
jgi:hypothetical protein